MCFCVVLLLLLATKCYSSHVSCAPESYIYFTCFFFLLQRSTFTPTLTHIPPILHFATVVCICVRARACLCLLAASVICLSKCVVLCKYIVVFYVVCNRPVPGKKRQESYSLYS